MKKVLVGLAAGALVIGLYAGSAFAAVTIDDSGTGFVGKGDVQLALGLNNAQMQAVADKLNFTYETVDTYAVTVEWTTGEGTKGQQTHIVNHTAISNIASAVDYNARQAKQYTGFILDGFKNTTVDGEIPQIGDKYPGKSVQTVTNIEKISSTSTLYVNGTPLQ